MPVYLVIQGQEKSFQQLSDIFDILWKMNRKPDPAKTRQISSVLIIVN